MDNISQTLFKLMSKPWAAPGSKLSRLPGFAEDLATKLDL